MKSTALIIGTLVAAGWAPIAAAQDPGERVVVAAIQERGYMGVQIAFEDGALVVTGVLPGTPAEKAGLEAGDRILSIGGMATKDQEQVDAFLAGTKVGQVLALHVERGDKHASIRIGLVSLAEVQPEVGELLPPARTVVALDRPVIVESRTEPDAAVDRLQSSRVQAISKLRADARLRSQDLRTEAEKERGRQIDALRLRSTAREEPTQETEEAAERRAELRVRAEERKARADARREAEAARKRAEDREVVVEDRTVGEEVERESAEDLQLQALKRELEGLRAELERLRAQIRKLSRETKDG